MSRNGSTPLKVLLAGESWMKHTVHVKGFDSFATSEYEEGAGAFIAALESEGVEVTYVRAHEIADRFPAAKAELDLYDTVILSDIGANSFLLSAATFTRSERESNRLSVLADYVRGGGGLIMVGGYMSFSGIDGKARYKMSPLADVLPVHMLDFDDRMECPEGVPVTVSDTGHEITRGFPATWPIVLGYNRVVAKEASTVVARCGQDPLLVTGEAGEGRSAAWMTDVAPHWAPPEFMEWPYFAALWRAIVAWVAKVDVAQPA